MRSDFAYMIDPAMFRELALPFMIEESETVDYIIFHTHTEDAAKNYQKRLAYLDVILDIPRVHAVQWECSGLPLEIKLAGMRRILNKGKLAVTSGEMEEVLEITSRLGKTDACKVLFMLTEQAPDPRAAEEFLYKLEHCV